MICINILDFGLAQYLHSDTEASSLRGSPLYMAPEILLKHQYDASVDLWSVGIILYGKRNVCCIFIIMYYIIVTLYYFVLYIYIYI